MIAQFIVTEPTRQQVEEALADVRDLCDGSEPESLHWLVAAARAWLNMEITDEMVERAARTIVQRWSGLKEGDTPEARANRVTLAPYWTDIARAALQAALTRSNE